MDIHTTKKSFFAMKYYALRKLSQRKNLSLLKWHWHVPSILELSFYEGVNSWKMWGRTLVKTV